MSQRNLPILTESIVRALTTPQSFSRGQELYQADAISNATRQGNVLTAHLECHRCGTNPRVVDVLQCVVQGTSASPSVVAPITRR